jgi:hypothetical protein
MPIWISPELRDSGVGIRAGTEGVGNGYDVLLGLESGVGRAPLLKPIRYGCNPFVLRMLWLARRDMSSLDSLFSKLGLTLAVLLELRPEDVLGLGGMTGGATVVRFLGGGGGGRGRSR